MGCSGSVYLTLHAITRRPTMCRVATITHLVTMRRAITPLTTHPLSGTTTLRPNGALRVTTLREAGAAAAAVALGPRVVEGAAIPPEAAARGADNGFVK